MKRRWHKLSEFAALLLIAPILSAAIVPPVALAAEDNKQASFASMLETITRQAVARIEAANASPELNGSGPYRAMMEVDLALPNATIYRPADLKQLGARKLGLLIWGNGGCTNDGASARAHLAEIASHGYLVIAPGKPLSGPLAMAGPSTRKEMTTTIQDLRALLDWALAENGRAGSPYYGLIDTAAIAAAGHSCGGMQAILLGDDPRVKTVLIHNSGFSAVLPDNPPLVMHEERLQGLRHSVLFVSGGPSDVLWNVTNASFAKVNNIEAVLVSSDVGHEGTFAQPHGGKAAQIAVDWLEWKLRGNKNAAAAFTGSDCRLCKDPNWTIQKKNIR